jgi:hypothetical protein
MPSAAHFYFVFSQQYKILHSFADLELGTALYGADALLDAG